MQDSASSSPMLTKREWWAVLPSYGKSSEEGSYETLRKLKMCSLKSRSYNPMDVDNLASGFSAFSK